MSMSTRNNNQQSIAKKPYCKVCHDAGKSEIEYTNHYVRSSPDRNGNTNVTCPTLLSTECRFCYKLGHTTKFCPVIATRKKYEEKSARLNQMKLREQEKKEKEKENKNSAKKSVSGFSAIYIDSDDEDVAVVAPATEKTTNTNEKKVIVLDEFPALCSVKTDKPLLTGYAAMASKSVSAKVVAEEVKEKKSNASIVVPPPMKKEFHVKKSWADWSESSEGEDEDEDEDDYDKEFPSFIDDKATYYEDCI